MLVQPLRYAPRYQTYPAGSDDNDPDSTRDKSVRQHRVPTEDLPYKVELWDAGGNSVEVILAVTASPSIGYAAFFAATREHPDRHITLRHKNSIVSRWAAGASH
jgi:hypothetical protein